GLAELDVRSDARPGLVAQTVSSRRYGRRGQAPRSISVPDSRPTRGDAPHERDAVPDMSWCAHLPFVRTIRTRHGPDMRARPNQDVGTITSSGAPRTSCG